MRPLACLLAAALAAQTPAPVQDERPTFRTTTNTVVVNVTVTDRSGKPVQTLTKDDFQLFEDGKLQRIQSCDLEKLETTPLPPPGPVAAGAAPRRPADVAPPLSEVQDRRLIVMLFDFSSMQPAEQMRSTKAAVQFLKTKMSASDLVSLMVFGTVLKTVVEFTADRDLLIAAIEKFRIGEASELAGLADAGADAEDQSGLFTADDTEFNIFNADRKLAALQDAAGRLRQYPQRKALVYLSSGIEKTGVDNQSQLRATVNTAVRSNVAFYPIDVRGLTASAPGGDASEGGSAGSGLFRGATQNARRNSFQNQQESLYALAAETGGKALLDSNDLGAGLAQVQQDIRSYYILTYESTNTAEDGRYRRIQIKLVSGRADLKAKLDFRPGYYAPVKFAKLDAASRETQLVQALTSENPVTDLPLAVEADYFRLDRARYFVPISVRIPGSALAFRRKGAKSATELDFIATVRDRTGQPALSVRDTIPLKLDDSTARFVAREQIQYETGGVLPPGSYTLRFIARENGDGKIGTFEMPFTVPDLAAGKGLRLSSMVLSSQTQAVRAAAGVKNKNDLLALNPLIDGAGVKTVPAVTRAFRRGQPLRVYLELYDPAKPTDGAPGPRGPNAAPSVVANVALYQGGRKVFESSPLRAAAPDPKRATAVPLRFEIPTAGLAPGEYECQVNVIDRLGAKFAFPRARLAILAAPAN